MMRNLFLLFAVAVSLFSEAQRAKQYLGGGAGTDIISKGPLVLPQNATTSDSMGALRRNPTSKEIEWYNGEGGWIPLGFAETLWFYGKHFRDTGLDSLNPIKIRFGDSTGTAINMIYMGLDSMLHLAPVPSGGGGGGSVTLQQALDNGHVLDKYNMIATNNNAIDIISGDTTGSGANVDLFFRPTDYAITSSGGAGGSVANVAADGRSNGLVTLSDSRNTPYHNATGIYLKHNAAEVFYQNNANVTVSRNIVTSVNGELADTLGNVVISTGGGSVSSVGSGFGLTGGPITTTGTLLVDSSTVQKKMSAGNSGIVVSGNKIYNAQPRDTFSISQPDNTTLVFTQPSIPRTDTVNFTIPTQISSLVLNTPAVLYTNPVTFSNTSGAWSGTLSLISQSPYTVLGNHTSGSAVPTFGKLPINSISATGTPSSTTVLYGDGRWAAASGGSGTLAIGEAVTSSKQGGIFFGGTNGIFEQDSTNLFWDSTNHRLGIGSGLVTPLAGLEVFTSSGSTGDALPNARFGSFEVQSVGGQNSFFGENIYWNGTAYKARVTGNTSMLHFSSGDIKFYTSGSTTAGATVSRTNGLTIFNSGKVGIRGLDAVAYLTVPGGDNPTQFANASIALGYQTTGGFSHFIHTRHNSSTGVSNAIDFYTSDGTNTGVYPTNAIHGLTITNGTVGINGVTTPNQNLDVSGSFGAAITTVTANTTLSTTHYTVLADATSGNITITLPTAASTTQRRIYIIKKIDASANTVSFTTAEGTQTLSTQWSGKQVQSTTANWYIIGSF